MSPGRRRGAFLESAAPRAADPGEGPGAVHQWHLWGPQGAVEGAWIVWGWPLNRWRRFLGYLWAFFLVNCCDVWCFFVFVE